MNNANPKFIFTFPTYLRDEAERLLAGRSLSAYIVEAIRDKNSSEMGAKRWSRGEIIAKITELLRLLDEPGSVEAPAVKRRGPKPVNEVLVARKWREEWTKAVCYALGRKLGPDLWDEKQKQGLEFFNAAHAWVVQQEKFDHEMTLADYVAYLRGDERFEKLLSCFTPEALRFVGVDPSAEM